MQKQSSVKRTRSAAMAEDAAVKSNPRAVSDTRHFLAAMQMFHQQPQLQTSQSHISDPASSDTDPLYPQGLQGGEHRLDFGNVIFPAGGSCHADKYTKQQVSAQTALLLRLPPKERASFMHRELYAVSGPSSSAASPPHLPADAPQLMKPSSKGKYS